MCFCDDDTQAKKQRVSEYNTEDKCEQEKNKNREAASELRGQAKSKISTKFSIATERKKKVNQLFSYY